MIINLIGQLESKRTEYFLKAGMETGVKINLFELGEHLSDITLGGFVKIDPPKYKDFDISNLGSLTGEYINFLKTLSQNKELKFLNHPQSIIDTLDKKRCKEILEENEIPITPIIKMGFDNMDCLRKYVCENAISGVFIKPRYGSGAAGVLGYRYNKITETEAIYTSMKKANGKFINTRNVERIDDNGNIGEYVDFVLSNGAVVEKWIPKPEYNKLNYDLRVVYQFGSVDFIVARCSNSPITNLHLNNKAAVVNDLNLPKEVFSKIDSLCKKVMACFKGLNYAGIDILLKGKNLEPVVIEVNAQGDLIYMDIYNENKIYKNQILRMMNYG